MHQGLEISYTLFIIIAFLVVLQKWKFVAISSLPVNFISVVFVLKIVTGFILTWIYTEYYTSRLDADIFKYFDDSKIMYESFWTKPADFFKMISGNGDAAYFTDEYYSKMNNWFKVYQDSLFNDSQTIIRFNAVLRFFSFGIYHVHMVIMCFISLIGIVAMYKSFAPYFKGKETIMGIILFLMPSVLFWTSGVLKEGLLIFGLGIFIYGCFQIRNKNYKWYVFVAIIISAFLLLYLKIYTLLILTPLLIVFLLTENKRFTTGLLTYSIVGSISILMALNLKNIDEKYDVLMIISDKQNDFIIHANHLESGSILDIEPIEPDFISLLAHSPEAFFNSLCRPFVFESKSPLMILAGIENMILLLLIVMSIYKRSKLNLQQKNLFLFLILYGIAMFTLIGLITPVMGALVRYKVPALPLFAIAFVLLGDWKMILNNRPKLKKLLNLS